MGSRGAFVGVDSGDYRFVDDGQTYFSLGEVDGVKVIMRPKGSVKAPEYSHTANRTYAIVQDGKLKHLTFYGYDHKQEKSIDLLHSHHGLIPHKHLHLNHSDRGIPITFEEEKLIQKIKRRFGLS